MGRKRFGRRKNRNRDGNDDGSSESKRPRVDAKTREEGFKAWITTNDQFIEYYKKQGIVQEDEWQSFMDALARPLPTTFRINFSCAFAEEIQAKIRNEFTFENLKLDDKVVPAIRQLEWYPDKKGFHWALDRREVKKLPELKDFQKWLVSLTASGDITRQEAVSMIPPLLLGVEPHHKVLDMCAAPGSKTSQLLELIHSKELTTGETPTGIVVANDKELRRAYTLAHQCKRIGSPALIVTCGQAQLFPNLAENSNANPDSNGKQEETAGIFDRVLCDVPCSGDGTLRKNPEIWRTWNPKDGLSLHQLQICIAKRGLSLLKMDGMMCYSTCSFNPIENEAVIAELLRWGEGALELVDVSSHLPALHRRAGLEQWTVMDKNMQTFNSFEDVPEASREGHARMASSMFTPSEEERKKFNLDRCVRCVPHDDDSGGFFICLIKKVGPLTKSERVRSARLEGADKDKTSTVVKEEIKKEGSDGESQQESVSKQAGSSNNTNPNGKDRRRHEQGEYVRIPQESMDSIANFLGFEENDVPIEQLYSRSDTAKAISFVTPESVALLRAMNKRNVEVVHAGMKVFEKHSTANTECPYRVNQEGVHLLRPFMKKRLIHLPMQDYQHLLQKRLDSKQGGDLMDFNEFSAQTEKLFAEASVGSIVCLPQIASSDQMNFAKLRVLPLVIWRGRNSVNVLATEIRTKSLQAITKSMQ